MVQAGGHDGAEFVGGQGGNEVEDGIGTFCPGRLRNLSRRDSALRSSLASVDLTSCEASATGGRRRFALQPQEKPQDLHPGESVRLRQAEVH